MGILFTSPEVRSTLKRIFCLVKCHVCDHILRIVNAYSGKYTDTGLNINWWLFSYRSCNTPLALCSYGDDNQVIIVETRYINLIFKLFSVGACFYDPDF